MEFVEIVGLSNLDEFKRTGTFIYSDLNLPIVYPTPNWGKVESTSSVAYMEFSKANVDKSEVKYVDRANLEVFDNSSDNISLHNSVSP
jgi:hypothetical protein